MPQLKRRLFLPRLSLVLLLALGCSKPHFDSKECLETLPQHVLGLQVLAGPRTAQSIIRDMRPAVCNAQVLFNRMRAAGDDLAAGQVEFRVTVEYTGEVTAVNVLSSTIASDQFVRKVTDFIMASDFVNWTRHEEDALFVYPLRVRSF